MSKPGLLHLGFHGTAELSYEDNCLHGKILFIDDLITYEAETPEGLKNSFIEAVDRYLAYCKRTGKPPNKPYSGTFNVRVGSEIHREACTAAAENEQPLNDFVKDALVAALTKRQFVLEIQEKHHHYHQESYEEEATQSWSEKNQSGENRTH